MIHTKLFEVLDAQTFIPCVATCLTVRPIESFTPDPRVIEAEAEEYLVRRCGFAPMSGEVFLAKMTNFEGRYDPSGWGNRTMETAHKHIRENWEHLRSGEVVDVQFILGETTEPKQSERNSGSLWAGVYKGDGN